MKDRKMETISFTFNTCLVYVIPMELITFLIEDNEEEKYNTHCSTFEFHRFFFPINFLCPLTISRVFLHILS